MAVKKIPSYLKGLAERHARTQAHIEALETTIRISEELARHHQSVVDSSLQQLAKAQVKLHSLEVLIRDYNDSLDPSKIDPIKAWRDRYGKRGQLEKDSFELVRLTGDYGMTSAAVYEVFAKRLEWPLDGPLAEKYKANRMRPALKRLQTKGLIRNFTLDGVSRWVAVEHLSPISGDQMKVLAQFQ